MVKLKRKLHYRGHVFLQNIQPQRVLHALHILQSINPLYSDITVDHDWMQNSSLDSPELCDSLLSPLEKSSQESSSLNVTPLTTPVIHSSTSTRDTAEYDNDENEENERSRLSGIPCNTCIQPKDISSEDNIILSIALGEGKKPKGFDDDKFSEQLSFPHLFPTGMFGYTTSREKKRISIKKYFQSRLLNADGIYSIFLCLISL